MARKKFAHRVKKSSKRLTKKSSKRLTKRLTKKLSKFQSALLHLKKLPKRKQQQAISRANNKFINQLCSRVKRLKYAKLNARQKKLLRKQRGNLQTLVNKRTSVQRKRQLLSQRGGFLPFLIPLVASVVAPALGAVIEKAVNR